MTTASKKIDIHIYILKKLKSKTYPTCHPHLSSTPSLVIHTLPRHPHPPSSSTPSSSSTLPHHPHPPRHPPLLSTPLSTPLSTSHTLIHTPIHIPHPQPHPLFPPNVPGPKRCQLVKRAWCNDIGKRASILGHMIM